MALLQLMYLGMPKCMSCHKAIVLITGRAHCFHDNIYITLISLLWDSSTMCVVDHLWPLIYIYKILLKTLLFSKIFRFLYRSFASLIKSKETSNKNQHRLINSPYEVKYRWNEYHNNFCDIYFTYIFKINTAINIY